MPRIEPRNVVATQAIDDHRFWMALDGNLLQLTHSYPANNVICVLDVAE